MAAARFLSAFRLDPEPRYLRFMGWIALLLGLAGAAAAAFFLVRLTQRTFFD